MLQADKQVLLASTKVTALELRQRELEFHVERYTNLATQASVIAGFSFESLVELEVPEGTNPVLASFYFVFGASAMALALYVLCVASFACVFGHRLALQGPHGSLEKAVHILVDHRLHIFAAAGASLACLVCAAVLMAWIKMGLAASVVTLIFLVFGYAVASRMYLMFDVFQIADDQLVTGATRVQNPKNAGAVVDLANLNPASRTSATPSGWAAPRQGAAAYSCLHEEPATAAATASESPRAVPPSLHYEGHLFKKGEAGFLVNESTRRRYFVLRAPPRAATFHLSRHTKAALTHSACPLQGGTCCTTSRPGRILAPMACGQLSTRMHPSTCARTSPWSSQATLRRIALILCPRPTRLPASGCCRPQMRMSPANGVSASQPCRPDTNLCAPRAYVCARVRAAAVMALDAARHQLHLEASSGHAPTHAGQATVIASMPP